MADGRKLELEDRGGGIRVAPGARLIDRTGRKRLPIGDDGFVTAGAGSVVVDKTMFIADILDSGYKATLFCRPRRFGKTLNMTMVKAFLEIPVDGVSNEPLFVGTDVWEAAGGSYRSELGRRPVIYLSLRTAKGLAWRETYGALRNVISAEYRRHGALLDSPRLSGLDRDFARRMAAGKGSEDDYADSLARLAQLLKAHHGSRAVILIDEYDAPVMASFSLGDGGYYREVVAFLKRWLTGALKDGGEALDFACLTGVQRISKESIFSDLNNLVVNTSLSTEFDERFGFSDAEVAALATYLGRADCMDEARAWYDGYRFGAADVYNPWSVINYLRQGCVPDVYWGNTSSNDVVGELLRHADQRTLDSVYRLLEPGGTVVSPLDLGVVFPDIGVRPGALWSVLYLAGYLTTVDSTLPNNPRVPRRLTIPNHEVSELYRGEVVERFALAVGGRERLDVLHDGFVSGDVAAVASELSSVFRDSASTFDLTNENGAHMLVLGLLFGIPGYADPESNREHGDGRPDIRVEPMSSPFAFGTRPLLTVELKFARDASKDGLEALARVALEQIRERGYDEGPLPAEASGRVRWGIATSGKHVVALAERA